MIIPIILVSRQQETGSLTCLRRDSGEGPGVGGAMRGKGREGGCRGRTGEESGTCSRGRVLHGCEWIDVTEPEGSETHTHTHTHTHYLLSHLQ